MKCGGTSDVNLATDEIKQMVVNLKAKVEEMANASFAIFEAHSFTSQVVAGTNYFVKIKVDEGKYIHARIFKPLPCYGDTLEVQKIETGKTVDEEVRYF